MNASDYLKRSRKIDDFLDYFIDMFGDENYGAFAPDDKIDIDYNFYNQILRLINNYRFSAHEEFYNYCRLPENKEECETLLKNNMDKIIARLELSLKTNTIN